MQWYWWDICLRDAINSGWRNFWINFTSSECVNIKQNKLGDTLCNDAGNIIYTQYSKSSPVAEIYRGL